VIPLDEDAGLGREDVEWREAKIGYAVDRPDVAAVRVYVVIDVFDPVALAIEQLCHVEPLHVPAIALLNTLTSATDMNDDAT
jgi:hypothetical protein